MRIMLSIMPDWSFAMMLWLLPVVFFIHDGEEIATMEWWLRKNKNNPVLSKISPVSLRGIKISPCNLHLPSC